MCSLLTPYHFLCLLLFFFLNSLPHLSSSSSSSRTHLCSHHEAAALIHFKTSFSINADSFADCDNAGIKSYPRTNSWKEGTDCCSWDGVTCDHLKGRVIGLDLSCSWLYGSFPSNSSLFLLQHLQKLNLSFNFFNQSKMSSKFGRFPSLMYLNLSHTNFRGQVPSQVSHSSKLVSLDLSGNYEQTLDKHTVKGLVHNLTEVRQLFLDAIRMSSINPNVFMNLSSSLRSVSLNRCDLRGEFPENIFHLPNLKLLHVVENQNLSLNLSKFNQSSNLEDLDLSFTPLSIEFIDSLDNLQSLKYLDLSGTSFFKGLPVSITNLSSLESLIISAADLSGGLPDSMGNLISLKHLDLSNSNLSGSIPRSLGNLLQLIDLDLSLNQLSGQLPSSLTNLTHLESLSIEHNQLEGSIPDDVTAFPNLNSLDLSRNLLNGTLPSWLYTVSSLEDIFLDENQFSGHIMEFQSKSIEFIDLGDNKLQGPIPSSIFQLANLMCLSLPSNNLSVVAELDMFSKLQNLQILDLSYNSLSLTSNSTASADPTLPSLRTVRLSSCNVNEFPQFLRGSSGLRFLDLSNNRICGAIPKWMWDVGKDSLYYLNLSHNCLTKVEQPPWKYLRFFDLSSNLIHGNLPIPAWTTNIFLISNNSLSGKISSLVCNASDLQILDLSHNNLTGVIPQCFGNLSKSLSFLDLQKNKFYGIIPQTFAAECKLSNLNLNGNQFEGPLTRSILNCGVLEVIDLGNNKINDTFPHWLGTLPQLKVLVLKSNQMHGSILDIGRSHFFSKIQIFDLSNNYFAGPLPVGYLKNFRAMINLAEDRSALSYMGTTDFFTSFFYSYSIGIVIKGREMELVKIFTMWMIIDLSSNQFQGEIPKVIGKLNALKGLNLSHNNLNGYIPTSIGNLTNLEWLDLSSNKLAGKIPKQLLDLTSLSFLNLSNNELDGCIPQGKQFNTFETASYEGNEGLRGFPISRDCSNNKPPQLPPSNILEEDDSKSNIDFGWKMVSIGYGCGVMFGLTVGYVVFQTGKPKWVVNLVEGLHHRGRKRSKIGNRSGGGRRIQ